MNAFRKPSTAAQLSTRADKAKQRGQGMTEYIIVVALIAVAAIGVFRLFGETMRFQMSALAREMSGQDGGSEIENAGRSANEAVSVAAEKKNLSNYSAGNTGSGEGSE